jgi:hypothetical protein
MEGKLFTANTEKNQILKANNMAESSAFNELWMKRKVFLRGTQRIDAQFIPKRK